MLPHVRRDGRVRVGEGAQRREDAAGGQRLVRWGVWALFCGACALLLSGARRNTGLLPINSSLWSLSFVLAAAALACVLLGACYLLVDVLSVWSGAPFTRVGMNPLALFVLARVLAAYPPFTLYTPATHGFMLLRSILSVLAVIATAYLLHHKGVLLKLG